MRKCLWISFISILISNQVPAQFQEGYLIKNNNDTIHGYVRFEGSITNSDHCAFKPLMASSDKDIQIYRPGEIKAFRFTGGKYFSSWEITSDGQSKTVFLEWLIQGRSSLLTYSPSVIGIRYFLLVEDGSLVELFNTDNRNEYKSILNYYFRDCPQLKPKIEAVSFTSKSLINLTRDYHERTCDTWDCIVYEDTNRNAGLSFGVSVNYLSSRLYLRTDKPEGIFSGWSPGYGIVVKADNLPLLSSKFSLMLSLMFQNSLFRFDTTLLTSPNPAAMSQLIDNDDRLFRIKYIRVPVQIKYKFLHGTLTPYVSLGATMNFRYSYIRYNQRILDYILENQGFNYNTARTFQPGFNAGAGLEFNLNKEISMNLGYEFEYWSRFFSNSANERSLNRNHSVYFRTIYKF